ncbi:MAG TPA: GNAT family N-acetyltransferase, partial [Alphaproteobacteria bacterium]|nr:GNAT family N-acetyltransferase [Alphaproteobacteria bacterium]
RLVQAAYHNRSLALYTKLGFDCREQLSKFYGTPPKLTLEGYRVRAAGEADIDACNAVCVRVHGHTREGELRDSIAQGTARVVEHLGRISGYASDIAFFGHAVGESNSEIKALIGGAREIGGGGFLVPTRNGDLMRWCLNNGLKIVHQLTLMTIGLYNEPQGAWIPSILY